jgi:dipeptidyl aminopeptidase/acylaminoacyl peptidase
MLVPENAIRLAVAETMHRDLRATDLYKEIEALCTAIRQPGTGQLSDAVEINAAPDGRQAVFAGTMLDAFEGTPPTHICLTELSSGETRVLTFGPNTDRLPKFSPDGRWVAFLSDRHKKDDFQLYLLDPKTAAAKATPHVDGWVEYLHWSPDGKRILLGVAGHGADVAGGQGAVTSKQMAKDVPSWMPSVETGDESFRWRRAWVYELATDRARQVSHREDNIWEAVWCGNRALAAVVSPAPGEGLWYSAHLGIVPISESAEAAKGREIYTPKDQLGWPAGSPSGHQLAVVEAVCSDRWIVAGDLRLIDTASGKIRHVDTRGVDVTYMEWRSDRQLLIAGHRGFETVIGLCDGASGTFTEVWRSAEFSSSGFYVKVSGVGERGDFVMLGESFARAPEVAHIRGGEYKTIRSFDVGFSDHAAALGSFEAVTWTAPDGLEIRGWLLKPSAGRAPHPLVLNIHGGPVWQFHPVWLGRAGAPLLALLKHGYAILQPNPRGSTGRGQEFARRVFGDMGGGETHDHLSGIDHLVKKGIADPKRLGVTGGSHGGYMSSWLITQDQRFAAAVPVAPVTNYVSEHLISNIPHFCSLFLADKYNNPAGKYFTRSPIMYAHKVKTPTLNVCGALDRCTPPSEAMQFHNALLENGVKSVLVTYPEEGHGVRKFPAAIDFAARLVGWFEEHLKA